MRPIDVVGRTLSENLCGPCTHFDLLGYFQSYQLTWSYLLDQLVAGMTLGSLYGLMAIGYSMVYGVLKLLNFAHGEVFMIGAYIGYFVLVALGGSLSPDVPVALLIFLMLGGRDDRLGRARSRRRALRLPAAAKGARAADRAADQRARRLVLPAAARVDLLRHRSTSSTTRSVSAGGTLTTPGTSVRSR